MKQLCTVKPTNISFRNRKTEKLLEDMKKNSCFSQKSLKISKKQTKNILH